MSITATPKRKAFLTMLYIGLAKEGYFETKGVPVKFTNPLTKEEFFNQYGTFIKNIFRQLWGKNLDLITAKRVTEAMRGVDTKIIEQAQRNISVFGETVFKPGMANVIGKGGQKVLDAINDMSNASMFFDITHPAVTDWLRDHTAEEIVGKLYETQAAAIKHSIRQSLKLQLPFQQTKEMLKHGMILTETEVGWVTNHYARAYDSYLKEYVNDGLGNPAGRAREAAQRFADRQGRRYFDNRQERIARTELSRAHGVAEQSSLIQAEENGYIRNTRRTWRRTSTLDNWPSSITNDGATVGLREPFPSGAMFPDEINERCILETRFELIRKPGRPGKPIARVPGVSKPKPKVPQTVKEAEAWALENNIADKVDWTGVPQKSIPFINEFQKILLQYEREYPRIRKFFEFIGTIQNRDKLLKSKGFKHFLKTGNNTIARTMTLDLEGITWNVNHIKNIERLEKIIIENGKNGFFPKGSNSIKWLIDHEMAHVLDNVYGIDVATKWHALIVPMNLNYFKVKNGLSEYATTNRREMMAEAWSEGVNSNKPREIAVVITKFINSFIRSLK